MGEIVLNVIVEDALSEEVARRLLAEVDYRGEAIFRVMRGNAKIREGLNKFIGASRFSPHVVLTDLDQYPCPPALLDAWGINRLPPTMLLRIAVREVESWLMADRDAISDFLHVAKEKVPSEPDAEIDTKKCLFGIVRRSRKRRLKADILPTSGSHIGPLYNEHFCRFVREVWCIEKAMENSFSLARSVRRLDAFCRDIGRAI